MTRSGVVVFSLVAASLAYSFLLDGSDPSLRHNDNPSLLEARSILAGTIALPQLVHDTALHRGQVVNVFQPGQTLFFLVQLVAAGDRVLSVFQVEMFLVFVVSVFVFSLALLQLSRGRAVLSASLVAAAMFGAPYIASFRLALVGSLYRVNHCLSILFVVCLLVLVEKPTASRRPVLVGACIGAAMLFRAQNVFLLFLPLSYLFQDTEGRSWQVAAAISTPEARKALAGVILRLLIFPAVAALVVAAFQMVRFQDPLETGYALLYDGRSDYLAQRAHDYGLFSLHFLPENLSRLIWAFPRFEMEGWRVLRIVGDPRGNSLLLSQPILLIVPFLWRSLRAARAQAFLAMSLLLAVPVWLYHNPGYYAPGYMRLSLDYLPMGIATLAVLARYTSTSKWVLWGSVGLAALSVWYGIALLMLGV